MSTEASPTIHEGFGKTDGLSMVEIAYYDRQRSKALINGLTPCSHCGRGIASGKGWTTLACLTSLTHFAHPSTDSSVLPRGNWQIVVLGSECAKNIPVAYREMVLD